MIPSPRIDDRLLRIRDFVLATYEDDRVISRYAELGLWKSEESVILEYVPDGAEFLDIGCGLGRTSIPLAEMGFNVTAIDLSSGMLRAGRALAEENDVNIRFENMDVMKMSFEDECFGVAFFSYNGFELVPGFQGKMTALREINRVLKPGGIFIFTSHSLFAINRFCGLRLSAFCKLLGRRIFGLPFKEYELGERFSDAYDEEVKYLQILPPSKIKKMLKITGFEILNYNTLKRIEQRKGYRFFDVFADGERFYVCQKN
ncbi:MAG: methyltransferase domain-containing protein [Candidatus Latescibacterota bacterium]|nr:methyltransferase domain-containing protein [Candidatus Latescibacterota bacterium]